MTNELYLLWNLLFDFRWVEEQHWGDSCLAAGGNRITWP